MRVFRSPRPYSRKNAKHSPGLCVAVRNEPEKLFLEAALKAGWRALHSGWPDFLLYDENRIACVEVKPDEGAWKLKHHQSEVLKILSAHGIPCYRWSPKRGFVRIGGSK